MELEDEHLEVFGYLYWFLNVLVFCLCVFHALQFFDLFSEVCGLHFRWICFLELSRLAPELLCLLFLIFNYLGMFSRLEVLIGFSLRISPLEVSQRVWHNEKVRLHGLILMVFPPMYWAKYLTHHHIILPRMSEQDLHYELFGAWCWYLDQGYFEKLHLWNYCCS